MLKKFVISLSLFCILGCQKQVQINAQQQAENIVASLNLTDGLIEVEAIKDFMLNDELSFKEGVLHVSNTNLANMVGVFVSDKPKDLMKELQAYLDALKQQNAGYFPSEIEKINHAILKNKGDIVYLVIADDALKAQQAVEEVNND